MNDPLPFAAAFEALLDEVKEQGGFLTQRREDGVWVRVRKDQPDEILPFKDAPDARRADGE